MSMVNQLAVETNTTHFSKECFRKLQEIMYMEKFDQGSRIYWEGDTNDKLYYLMEGSVKHTKLSEDGKDLTLNYFFQGDLFGEFDPMNKQNSACTAQAMENCKIGVIQQSDLEVLVWQNGDFAIEFTQWLSHMQYYTQLKLRDLLFHGKNGALAAMLIRTANTYGIRNGNRIVITEKFTNNELANLIGSTRETVNRMLATFRQEGLIKYDHGRIEILDLTKLKQICQCEDCPIGICRL
ncbi:Crp/Fnr family transcriptional regulator [Aquibacillus sp. 3ASR75-11]|uniref:Crp/Fnr family transcriptional regulator n=1 Tax=Terrihalobacillus insolitus TaxID=2950438 RepID=A0A9X3WT39_9BACI|nr:Crp/Fnr family transcriptional regulator [Terrihalobacillus insolitus]MDC3413500.1 Crp/Fnr family transcriptional regulator [Terrihalobacillus insolitus]MDC3425210.1 Crp/Fnr family transcriptional regulator [Terrihalobacillus insolitus]